MLSSADSPNSPRPLAGLRSVAFWLCLFVAAGLYAAVVLSPKWLVFSALAHQFESNQRHLLELNQRVERLRKLAAALESDPAFAREEARSEFDLLRPQEQRIRFESPVTLDVGPARLARKSPQNAAAGYSAWLRQIAGSRRLVDSLLAVAAGLVVFAFGCLYERSDRI
ncbi:MAG: septum formation initiator family protein [Planctomycetaceae bacterium]|nr:septum formation initiator family protein [Planctomycetaceae bacterium]